MIQKIKKYSVAILAVAILVGCASKEEEEYNKPAVYWYNKMIKQIATYRLDEADSTFTSLESEHRNSPLLPSATLIIANAHMQEEEYAMANYYLDEYLKKHISSNDLDYVKFLKIKSNFLAFKNQFREQELITKTIDEVEKFLIEYPNSQYKYIVMDIKSRLYMAKAVFDKEIADLYSRIEKPQAQKIYEKKSQESWAQTSSIKNVDVPWYRWIFE
ncbi:MAG: outer membrane protein assembly factor BamD [Campylobacterales bacterium]|nr:outer membrane protein assembly factor BamD [Campylobacterales bacterium]